MMGKNSNFACFVQSNRNLLTTAPVAGS